MIDDEPLPEGVYAIGEVLDELLVSVADLIGKPDSEADE